MLLPFKEVDMAIIPTPEQCDMRILRKYVKHDKRVGEGYSYGDIMNFQGPGWRQEDIETGLDFCLKKRWLEKDKNGQLVFTKEGYRVAPQKESHQE
jgi:hypothetical protein